MSASLLYHKGYQLFPLNGRSKIPLTKGWQTRTFTEKQLRNHATRGGNIGVAIHDGLVVLDFDPRNYNEGEDDRDFVRDWIGIDLESAPCVKTGAGGYHYYLSVTPGTRLRGRVPECPGMDIKQVGGLVVAPGSIHPDTGKKYEIVGEWGDPLRWDPPTSWLRNAAREGAVEPGKMDAAWLREYLSVFDPEEWRDYDQWIKMLTACHHATGGHIDACEVFVEWCAQDEQYADDSDVVRYKWDQARTDRAGGATLATLHWFAEQADVGLPQPPAASIFSDLIEEDDNPDPFDEAAVWEAARESMRFDQNGAVRMLVSNVRRVVEAWQPYAQWATDVFNNRIVTRGKTSFTKAGAEWNDARLLVLRGKMNDIWPNWNISVTTLHEAVDEIAEKNKFHPVLEWLDSLEWDGKDRADTWILDYLGADNPRPGPAVDEQYVREVGRLILDAMVARVERPGVKFDHIVVFEGAQGLGKSTACAILGGEWFSDNPPIGMDVKDMVSTMAGVWVFEVGELDALRRGDIRQIKSFVSSTADRARAAYARKAVTTPRHCIFLGTTNDRTYLADETGNRRFLPMPVGYVNMDALRRDRSQLLAEAWAKRTDRPLILGKAASRVAFELQADRRVVSGTELRVLEFLDELDEDEVSATQLLAIAGARPEDTHVARRVATVMEQAGWVRTRITRDGKTTRGYKRETVH